MKKEHQKIVDEFMTENAQLFEDLGNEKKDDLYKKMTSPKV
jgi:hypothetical protein